MNLLDFQNLPWSDVGNLVKAVREGKPFDALRPAAALFSWLAGKLTKPVEAEPLIGDSAPKSDAEVDAEMADALESAVATQQAAVRGEPVPVGAGGVLVSLLMPWLLSLLGRALAGKKAA